MQIVDSDYCFGPNIYSDRPSFWCIVDLGKLEGCYTEQLGPEFSDTLFNLLPGLETHSMEEGQPFASLIKNRGGVHIGRVLERIAIELQRLADLDVSWSTTLLTEKPSHCKVVVECNDKVIYIWVLKFALFILNTLLPEALRDNIKLPPGYNNKKHLQALLNTLRAKSLGLTTNAIVEKAIQRKIPWQRLSTEFPFVQLGQGCFAKRVSTSVTSNDDPIRISDYKNVAVQFLAQIGVPVPKQVTATVREAVAAAHTIGYPVVIKPVEGKKGQGVTTGIMTDADAVSAARIAGRYGGVVVVEKHIQGDDHRLLIVNGRLVGAAKRIPAHVVGDGKRSIQQLVDEVNSDPRRGKGSENILVQLELDKKALSLLKRVGHSPKTVPRKDEIIYLRDTSNISTGGTAVDVTDNVHPDNRYIAETAVMQLGLAVGGVDFITSDIRRSWREVPGYIIEVNQGPGFRPHWLADPGRDVVSPILDMLFPGDQPSRIPIAAITGSNGKTTTGQMLAHILQCNGMQCGLATTQGVFIDGRQIIRGDLAGAGGAHRIFLNKQMEVAVVESSRRGLLRMGLPFDLCDVGTVLNVTNEHVGTDGIQTVDELARIKRLVAERATKAVVLNAEDEHCLAMAKHSPAQNLCLVATDKDNPHIQTHVDQGGHTVVLEKVDGRMQIALFDGNQWQPLIETADIAAGLNNTAFCNVTNAMFAAATAWEMGVSLGVINEGLCTFQSRFDNNPGRLNVYNDLPFRVVLDFAHNPAKYKSLVEFVISSQTKGRQIIVITSPGNRVDNHFQEIAQVCAGSFDHYFLGRWDDPRGRGELEIQEMFRDALMTQGVSADCITVCQTELVAVKKALAYAQAGDSLALAVQKHARSWQIITRHKV